jgi:hypothetical protein
MVTGSRPTPLTQHEVDDLARGQHVHISPRLHASRLPTAAEAPAAVDTATSPVPLATKDMQTIARSGTVPRGVLERIAAATPVRAPAEVVKKKVAKGKAQADSRGAASTAPTLRPAHPPRSGPGKG